MTNRHLIFSLAAFAMVAIAAPAIGGSGGPTAQTAISKKKVKKLIDRKAKRIAKRLDKRAIKSIPAGPKGDQGPQGPKGDPGQDATNLFAYVRDTAGLPGTTATLAYGRGAVGVSDPPGQNNTFGNGYVVTFDRDLSGCVAHANPGYGEPAGSGAQSAAASMMVKIVGATVQLWAERSTSAAIDTSFVLSVFCPRFSRI